MNIYDNYISENNAQKVTDYFKQEERLTSEVVEFNRKYDYYNGDMKKRTPPNLTKYARNVYNFTKKIIDFKSQFIFGKGIEIENLTPEFEKDYNTFLDSWNDSKLNSHYVKLAVSLFSYGKAAEIIILNEKNEIEHIALTAGKRGQEFYAFFDNNGDIGAFSRYYQIKELSENQIIQVEICEIYTKEFKYVYKKYNGTWEAISQDSILKMPIVYYEMPQPYTYQIKDLQDNYNEIINELSDVNSQVAYPFLIMAGEVLSMAYNGDDLNKTPILERSKAVMDKLNNGMLKVANLEGDADLRFVSWNAEPKTLIYEIDNLKDLMFKLTASPDLSLENLKMISAISGFALQILFLDSEIAKQGEFTLFFELKRALNLHAFYLNLENLKLSAKTRSFLPQETREIINNLAISLNSGLISQKTAIEQNPMVYDAVKEEERIKEENEKKSEIITSESFEI